LGSLRLCVQHPERVVLAATWPLPLCVRLAGNACSLVMYVLGADHLEGVAQSTARQVAAHEGETRVGSVARHSMAVSIPRLLNMCATADRAEPSCEGTPAENLNQPAWTTQKANGPAFARSVTFPPCPGWAHEFRVTRIVRRCRSLGCGGMAGTSEICKTILVFQRPFDAMYCSILRCGNC
jgi:hypothetical protein